MPHNHPSEMVDIKYVKPSSKDPLLDAEPFLSCLRTGEQEPRREMTKLLDGRVLYIDDFFCPEECEALCKAIDKCPVLSFWSTAGRENDNARSFRDADTIEVHSEELARSCWERIKQIFIEVSGVSSISISDHDDGDPRWERELPGDWDAFNLNHDLLFAKYPSRGAFSPHTDGKAIHSFNVRSFYSVIVFLNTIPKGQGGGTKFFKTEACDQLSRDVQGRWSAPHELLTAEIDPIIGRILIFDQSLVHEGVPPEEPHVKYIIRSDIMYQRRVPICDSEKDKEAYKLFREAEVVAERGDEASVVKSITLFRRALRMSPQLARIMGHA